MSRRPYPVILTLALVLPRVASPLGLGEIHVSSALNEPLSAQIDIVGASPEDLSGLSAAVASREIFQRYGADRPAFLNSAKFRVTHDVTGRPILAINSSDPFTDPLISLLVDLRWGKSELVREYSLLLDPPDMRVVVAAPAVAPAENHGASSVPATTGSPGNARAVGRIDSTPPAALVPRAAAPTAALAAHYRVSRRDTLRAIARRAGARSESQVVRMMTAIFHANPTAFDGNINRLRRGAVITLPSAAEIDAVPLAEASREVHDQMSAWRAGGPSVARTSPAAPTPIAPTALAAVTTPAPRVAPATNDEMSNEALQDRVQSLEQKLEELKRTLAATPVVAPATPVVAAPATPAVTATATPVVAPAEATPPSMPAAETAAPVATPVSQAATPVAPLTASAATNATDAVVASAHVVESAAPEQPPVKVDVVDAPAAAPRELNLTLLGGLAVAALLGAYGWMRWRRFKAVARPRYDDAAENRMVAGLVAESAAMKPTSSVTVEEVSLPTPHVAEVAKKMQVQEAEISAASTAEAAASSELEIDIEALENSYLDTNIYESTPLEATSEVNAVAEVEEDLHTVAMESIDMDMTVEIERGDTRPMPADITERMMPLVEDEAVEKILAESAARAPAMETQMTETKLDYDLLDLDTTAQHVQMPSGLNENVITNERRANIADVLRTAIDRDPNRRDLRMKLLEVYYGAAATNRLAFLEMVRKFASEPDALSAEDWDRVMVMGRQIASDDALFAAEGNHGARSGYAA